MDPRKRKRFGFQSRSKARQGAGVWIVEQKLTFTD